MNTDKDRFKWDRYIGNFVRAFVFGLCLHLFIAVMWIAAWIPHVYFREQWHFYAWYSFPYQATVVIVLLMCLAATVWTAGKMFNDWGKCIMIPVEVSKEDVILGGDMGKLLPKWDDIPKEFKDGSHPYCDMVSTLFFSGGRFKRIVAKDGFDAALAFSHIKAILVSFEPKHEHKEAACAYLFDLWFEKVELY